LPVVFAALMAIPAYLTGEGAEEHIEKLPDISKASSESHEKLGLIFIWLSGGLGIVALVSLIADTKHAAASKYLYLVCLFISLITIGFAKQLGTTGGEIRHSEIRSGATVPASESNDED
jgi:asparagine N-glycosylation enzyme membrane subunit Stt3